MFLGINLPDSFCHSRNRYWFTSSPLRNLWLQVRLNSSSSFSQTSKKVLFKKGDGPWTV